MYKDRHKEEGKDEGEGRDGRSGLRTLEVCRDAVIALCARRVHRERLSSRHTMTM